MRVKRILSCLAVLTILVCGITQPIQADGQVGSLPVLLLDPGHGGEDGGAVACDGTIEAELNWKISNRCLELSLFLGLPAELTREAYEIQYPEDAKTVKAKKTADQKSRAALVNSRDHVILLSIHQNKFTSASPFGPQVFYNDRETAQSLAERLQEALTGQLCPSSRRVAAPVSEDVWLMRQAVGPAVLVECGFLSNSEETEKLKSMEYQKRLCLLIVGSYIQEIQKTEAPDESENNLLLYGLRQ